MNFRIEEILGEKVKISDVLLKKSPNKGVGHILGSVAVQIGIIDIFSLLQIKPTENVGYSFGELLSAYSEGSLSVEETVNYAFLMDNALNNIKEIMENNNNNNKNEVNLHNSF